MAGTSSRNGASRYAVVDVGSNTIHLLIADSNGRTLATIDDQSTRLRLGEDVAHGGSIDRGKIQLAVDTVSGYVKLAQRAGAKMTCLLGTQAVRAATNGSELAESIQRATAVPLLVIDPSTEAQLGYLGTTLDVPVKRPRLIMDIGGGSTQLLLVESGSRTNFLGSLPIGSVSLPARFLRNDPPRRQEREAMELAVMQAAGSVAQRRTGPAAQYAVLIGGAGRRLRRAGRLDDEEPLVKLWVERMAETLLTISAEAMEMLGAVRFEDADMVRAGAVVLREVMNACNLQYCLVSENGIREGAVLTLARGQ
ncbi:MAG TPA: hypothetical protein VKU60_16510, partial [Chloroflexota bacterium]|nr:hypothetical protein [Chloroflexota bacterium]